MDTLRRIRRRILIRILHLTWILWILCRRLPKKQLLTAAADSPAAPSARAVDGRQRGCSAPVAEADWGGSARSIKRGAPAAPMPAEEGMAQAAPLAAPSAPVTSTAVAGGLVPPSCESAANVDRAITRIKKIHAQPETDTGGWLQNFCWG